MEYVKKSCRAGRRFSSSRVAHLIAGSLLKDCASVSASWGMSCCWMARTVGGCMG